MELRTGVAYDAELAAEVARRLGPGRVALDLAADGPAVGGPCLTRLSRAPGGRRRRRRVAVPPAGGRSAALDGPHRADDRQLLAVLAPDGVEVGRLDLQLGGDLVEDGALGRRDLVVRGGHQEACAHDPEPLLVASRRA